MITIAAAVAQICSQPAPVIVLDTCSLLDLFRHDGPQRRPRVVHEEIRTAADLLQMVTSRLDAVHLVVPELVPGEFADHADKIEGEFLAWLKLQDKNQEWLTEAALAVGIVLPAARSVVPVGLHAAARTLAEGLLARAIVLARDRVCLDRAVARLIAKRRPSHRKEMKDSMNLEQCLELTAQLRAVGFTRSLVFVSSNTNDFAEGSRLHPDLKDDFDAGSLEYFIK